MKFQVAKLYRGKHFAGYGIAVDGELLEGQLPAIACRDHHRV